MSATLDPNLAIGAVLFALGATGVLTRRNLIVIVLSAEMMLHGVALSLVTFSQWHASNIGQVFTIFVLTVAACEAGLALSLVLALYQRSKTLDVNLWSAIREPDLPPPTVDQAGPMLPSDIRDLPRITPSGRLPDPDGMQRSLLADSDRPRTRNRVDA